MLLGRSTEWAACRGRGAGSRVTAWTQRLNHGTPWRAWFVVTRHWRLNLYVNPLVGATAWSRHTTVRCRASVCAAMMPAAVADGADPDPMMLPRRSSGSSSLCQGTSPRTGDLHTWAEPDPGSCCSSSTHPGPVGDRDQGRPSDDPASVTDLEETWVLMDRRGADDEANVTPSGRRPVLARPPVCGSPS